MKPTAKTLHPYQARLVTDVCRTGGDVLVEQPTSSGKTMQIVTLVAMHLGRRFTHALISAPQEQIEHDFIHRDYQRVDWSRHDGSRCRRWPCPKMSSWQRGKATSAPSFGFVRSWWIRPQEVIAIEMNHVIRELRNPDLRLPDNF